MKRIAGIALAVLMSGAAFSQAAGAAGTSCATRWGSLPEVVETMSAAELTGIRSGRHACFDRLVLDFDGNIAGYRVEYVDAVRQDGSGFVVPVRGGARLAVVATAPVRPSAGFLRAPDRLADVSGYRTFRQVAWAGSFEGYSTIRLGVRARLPFRTLLLDGSGGGSRLVVDVAHRW